MTSRTAWGHGLATITTSGTVLDTWYPSPVLGDHDGSDLPAALVDLAGEDEARGVTLEAVLTEIDLDASPADARDAYLRLHLLSHRLVRPNSINLDGLFGALANVVWTNHGPCSPEGFVNFNAGTLGSSMVEGRISQGVVVGDGSDIGGGASTMGTLSGGGTERVAIGERCLLGAESGIGIALGDDCVVEAGLYVTAGTKVTLADGRVVKAAELSGQSNLLFIRDSVTGTVLAKARDGHGIALNSELHAND